MLWSWQMSARIHVWWTIFKQWISYTYIEENLIINLLIWKINTYVFKQLSRAPKDFFSVNNGRTRKAKHFLITIPFVKGIRRFPNLCTIFGGCVSHISLPRLIPIIVKKRSPQNLGIMQNVPLNLLMKLPVRDTPCPRTFHWIHQG